MRQVWRRSEVDQPHVCGGAANTTSGAELSVDWLTDVRTQNVELYVQYHQSLM